MNGDRHKLSSWVKAGLMMGLAGAWLACADPDPGPEEATQLDQSGDLDLSNRSDQQNDGRDNPDQAVSTDQGTTDESVGLDSRADESLADDSQASDDTEETDGGLADLSSGADESTSGDGSIADVRSDMFGFEVEQVPDVSGDTAALDLGLDLWGRDLGSPVDLEDDCELQPVFQTPAYVSTRINGQRLHYTELPDPDGLVMVFHGAGGSADLWKTSAEFVAFVNAATERNLMVAALTGTDNQWGTVCCENDAICCTESAVCCDQQDEDVQNVFDAAAYIIANTNYQGSDARYAVGFSNGGGFVARLTQSVEFDAVAVFSMAGSNRILRGTEQTLPPMFFVLGPNDPI
ncbi:MAG: hypothetical protein KC561_12750, partial [Myxococcales bacterium]|nr:hypothetical protein [Myxococcales bacterium]